MGIAEGIKPLLSLGAADYNQALTAAARDGRLLMTRWLVENGVTDPSATDGVGNTPLKYAIQRNFPEVAEVLRQRGARETK